MLNFVEELGVSFFDFVGILREPILFPSAFELQVVVFFSASLVGAVAFWAGGWEAAASKKINQNVLLTFLQRAFLRSIASCNFETHQDHDEAGKAP